MTVREFMILAEMAANPQEVREQIEGLDKPMFIGKVQTSDTLDDITMGELMQVQGITTVGEYVTIPCRVLLGMNDEMIERANVMEVLGFSLWVSKEVERINKLFASTSVKPTSEEVIAGVEKLSFGMFGLLDYFAKRMGITNHEEVESVPWVRVYKCLEMDAEKIRYEKRLQEVYNRKNKTK